MSQTRSSSPAVSRPLSLGLRLAMAAYIVWVAWEWGFRRVVGHVGVDYIKHWEAARCLFEGTSPYVGSRWLEMGFNYPQATAFVFGWLGWFSQTTAETLWEWAMRGCVVGCVGLAWRVFAPPGRLADGDDVRAWAARHWGWLVGLVVALYNPLTTCLWVGNIDPWNALLAVAMTAALLRRHDRVAGVCWALLILCKMLPLVLIVPLLLWRRGRVVRTCGVAMVVYALLLWVTGRWGYEWYFVREVIPRLSVYWRHISISLARGLAEWVMPRPPEWMTDGADEARRFAVAATGVSVIGLGVWVAVLGWMRRRRIALARALEWAWIALPLLSPLLEWHHFVWSLPALFLQMRRVVVGGARRGAMWISLVGWLMIAQSHTLLDLWGTAPLAVHFLPTLGALLVAAALLSEFMPRAPRRAIPGWLRRVGPIVVVYVLIYVAHGVWEWSFLRAAGAQQVDFTKHWVAARALMQGATVYRGPDLWLYFNYPQATAFVFMWLGWLSRAAAEVVWEWGLRLVVIGCGWIAWRSMRPRASSRHPIRQWWSDRWLLTVAFVLVFYNPLSMCVWIGNIDPWNALGIMAMAALLMRRRDGWAGACWAALILCKMLPVVLIVPLLFWRRWRALAVGGAILVGYGVLLIALGRVDEEWFFVTEVIPRISARWQGISISLAHALLVVVGRADDLSLYTRLSAIVSLVVAVGYTALLWTLRRRRVPLRRAFEMALLIVPLMSPLLELHHLIWILPVLFRHLSRWLSGRMPTRIAVGYAVAWVLIAQNHSVTDLIGHAPPLWHFMPLACVIALIALEWVELKRGGGGDGGAHSKE